MIVDEFPAGWTFVGEVMMELTVYGTRSPKELRIEKKRTMSDV